MPPMNSTVEYLTGGTKTENHTLVDHHDKEDHHHPSIITNSKMILMIRRSLSSYNLLQPPRATNSTLEVKASVVLEKIVSIGENGKIDIVFLFPFLSPVILRRCWEHHHPKTKNGGNINFITFSLVTVYSQASLLFEPYKAICNDTCL